jgi:putative ABC transport system substrate-binding protein
MPMKVVRLLQGVALVFLLCAASVRPSAAAEGGKPRIVALVSAPSPVYEEVIRGFRETLADSGRPARVDTVVLSDDHAATKRRLRQADIVFALGSRALREAVGAGTGHPVIASMVMRKEELQGGDGGVTGVFLQHPLATQFRHLKTFLPDARRIAVMYSPGENRDFVDRAAAEGAAAGFELVTHEVRSPGDIPRALKDISRNADALWGIPDRTVLNTNTAKEILLFSFRNRIPFVGLSPNWVKSGALYALGWDYRDIGAQCAAMAAAVLRGQQAGTIPPEAPRKVTYTVNRRTGERMKLKLPQKVLGKASVVY